MTPNTKTVIISGGSRGLGAAIVEHCLQRGCNVASFARSNSSIVAKHYMDYQEHYYFEALDAAEPEALRRFVDRTIERFGQIDGLVNNAAIGQDHLLAHMPPEKIEQIIRVNLTAPIWLTQLVLKRMMLNEAGGRIVNITSICGTRGYAGLTIYAATKGGLEAFTRSLAREVGARQILVNCVAPGFFASEMSSVLAQEQLKTIRRRTPTERLCTETDILPVVDMMLFLDINMTGQTVWVDGGSSI